MVQAQPSSVRPAADKANPVGLTPESVKRLLDNPSTPIRAQTAAGVAKELSYGNLGEDERRIACEIIGILARDVEASVRQALAENVRHCPFLPPEIARELANDIEAIALPVIRYSSVLTDDDLIQIVRKGAEPKQLAVAGRDVVSADVADALIDTGRAEPIKALLANNGAMISETGYGKVIHCFPEDRSMHQLMVRRPILPLLIAESLIAVIAEDLREELIQTQDLPLEIIDELVGHGTEPAISQAAAAAPEMGEVHALALRLHAKGGISPTLMLRAICLGDLLFFESAMAIRAGIPIANAKKVLHEGGAKGFEQLYEKAGLPERALSAFKVAVDVIGEVGWDKAYTWRLGYSHAIAGRLAEELGPGMPSEFGAILSTVTRSLARGEIRPS